MFSKQRLSVYLKYNNLNKVEDLPRNGKYSRSTIILCGGSCTRLWPLSRESYPKQFLNLDGEDKKSLLQNTQERILHLDNAESYIDL